MGAFTFGIDAIYAPFEIIQGVNDQIVVSEDGGSKQTVTLNPGRYWNYLGSSAGNPDDASDDNHEGFQDYLASQISTDLSNSYLVTHTTPANSALTNTGVQYATSGTSFTFHCTDSNFTLDPRLLGLSGRRDVSTNDQPYNPSTDLASHFSLFPNWQPHNLLDGKASTKDRRKKARMETSGDNMDRAAVQRLNQTIHRKFTYEYVPAAHVKENRADDEGSAQTGSVSWYPAGDFSTGSGPYGDTHNAFEGVWDYWTRPGKDGKAARLIVVHDEADTTTSMENQPREYARLQGPDGGLSNPKDLYKMQRTKGEFYKVEFNLQVFGYEGYEQ